MKNVICSLFVFLLFAGTVSAQYLEAGLMLGTSHYQGDLSSSSFRGIFNELHPAGGVFVKYNWNNYLATKLGGNFGKITGDDANLIGEQAKRNLSFSSSLWEVGLTVEFNILGFQPYALQRVFSPYVFVGGAIFGYNPQAFYEGEWHDLQPLGTEGQGLEAYPERDFYELREIAIPFGVGAKYAFTDKWTLGFEFGSRWLRTDYLDDVSLTYADIEMLRAARGDIAAGLSDRRTDPDATPGINRGNGKARDWYYMVGFTLSYNFLDNGLVGGRNKRKKGKGCYGF